MSEGLQGKIDALIKKEGDHRLFQSYSWEGMGMEVDDDDSAQTLMDLIDDDGGFAPTVYNKKKKLITFKR